MTHVRHNSGNQEWYTPAWIIEAARRTMGGIDLDPASNDIANATVQASRYYTMADNGLLYTWEGRVWLNPPYSQPEMGWFIDKLEHSLPTITSACVITNNATETKWGQQLLRMAKSVCFLCSRVKFLTPQGIAKLTGLQGQMVCYIGGDTNAFATHFRSYGIIVKTIPSGNIHTPKQSSS